MRVEIAQDGKKALDILKSVTDFDLVMMDAMMEGNDGCYREAFVII
jgi:CheY-like chemotaxis protein